jgi:hypothetical protein
MPSLRSIGIAAAIAGALVAPGAALAGDWNGRGRGWGPPHHAWHGPPPRAYYAPPPRVYYAPPPRYYYAPPPRVYYAPPPPVYYAPPPVWYGRPGVSLNFRF